MFKILEKLTAKNKKQDDIRMPSHLSAAEQKQVQTVIDRARGTARFRIRHRRAFLFSGCSRTVSAV